MAISNFLASSFAIQLRDIISGRIRVVERVKTLGECWECADGPHYKGGYGKVYFDYGTYGAHRLVFAMVFGDVLADEYVLHHCDNPPCIRPHHLFKGSHADNNRDMTLKGRRVNHGNPNPARGERAGLAKITDAQAISIRRRRDAGEKVNDLAREFHVGRDTISLIVNGHTFRHLL